MACLGIRMHLPFLACLNFLILPSLLRAEILLGTPVNFGPFVNSEFNENTPHMTEDGLSLFFTSNRPNGLGRSDIWTSTRASLDSEWSTPTNVMAVNSDENNAIDQISADGLQMLITTGVPSPARIYSASRANLDADWSTPHLVAGQEPLDDQMTNIRNAFLAEDGTKFLTAVQIGSGTNDLYESSVTLENRVRVDEISTAEFDELSPVLSSDQLTLFFASDRPGGQGGLDIWASTRGSQSETWGVPFNLGPKVNTPSADRPSQLWGADQFLLFKSGSGAVAGLPGEGRSDIFYVQIIPEPSSFVIGMVCLMVWFLGFRIRGMSLVKA